MDNSSIVLICILIISHTMSIVSGFMLCYMIKTGDNFLGFIYDNEQQQKNKIKPSMKTKDIEIDNTKIVLKIDTDNMEKKFDNITESKKQKNDVSSSVNKLKQMKGK